VTDRRQPLRGTSSTPGEGGLLGNIATFAALVFIAEAIRRGAGG
jgi:hypothetical protein